MLLETSEHRKRLEAQIVDALAIALSVKDDATGEHVRRVQIYAEGTARLLGCTELEVDALRAGALLHDLGKLGVPDYILHKPGKLTADEFAIMKRHTIIGHQILSRLDLSFPVSSIVRHHHERFDGGGYPDGLKSEKIPLTARILTVVDCFDAVREDRPYRKGMTKEQAIALLQKDAGVFYDPKVVETFVGNLEEFEAQVAYEEQSGELQALNHRVSEELPAGALLVEPAAGLSAVSFQEAAEKLTFSLTEVRKLCELHQHLQTSDDKFSVIAAFANELRDLVPYDSCAITLMDRITGRIEVACSRGEHRTEQRRRQIVMGEGVTGWVLENIQPIVNGDPRLDFTEDLQPFFKDYRTLIVAPVGGVTSDDRGAVSLYSRNLAEYTEEQATLLSEAIELLAGALRKHNSVPLPPHPVAPHPSPKLIEQKDNNELMKQIAAEFSVEALEKLYGEKGDGGAGTGDSQFVLA